MTEIIANDFVTKLKAHGTNKDFCDLAAAHEKFHSVLIKLPSKEKTLFSLNVLCILCRNLEKVPSWRHCINNNDFLKLCIDCVRHTRGVTGESQVKTLAGIYHVHKYIIKQNVSSVPPELVLKLSIMAFECDTQYMIKDYHKTYWSILADRINYIEKLKTIRVPIIKLLPKLNEDLTKVIQIYTDQYDFCANFLPFLVKKLNFIYSDVSLQDLNETYRIVFDNIQSYNLNELNDEKINIVFSKFSECLYVITETSYKIDFKDSPLDEIIHTCLSLFKHRADIFHCLQTFYLNSFLYIFNTPNNYENVFRNMLLSCKTTEKLGYKNIMVLTYPYINQLLRLYIEYCQRKKIKQMSENCLNFILFLMKKVQNCKQLIKCENCVVQTGFHDALRLSLLIKNIVDETVTEGVLCSIIEDQYIICRKLKDLGCINHEKYHIKLSTDTHNLAVQFYKLKRYDFAIRLFDFCIKNEFHAQNKNLCQALYNKSICELDNKMYENALKDAFLSMLFDNGRYLEKYMSLVLDIKGKAVNSEVENYEKLQIMSVLDACGDNKLYENLVPLIQDYKFSDLLQQEFSIYVKLWPSLVPITGVIRSLNIMINDKCHGILLEDKAELKNIFYDIILKTPDVVRSIQEKNFKQTIIEVLENMDYDKLLLDEKIVYIALLMMKSEHDFQDATVNFRWKIEKYSPDPIQSTINKSLSDEFMALKDCIKAVELLTSLKSEIKNVSSNRLLHFLHLCEMTIFQLLHMERMTHALQLAHIGLRLANIVGDKVSFIRCAGILLYHAVNECAQFNAIALNAVKVCSHLLEDRQSVEAALVFLCELGIYYARCKKLAISAQLLRKAKKCVVDLYKMYPDVNLGLALGRMMELGVMLSTDLSILSAVNIIQRHYLTVQPSVLTWLPRRRYQLQIRYSVQVSSVVCTDICRRLKLWRRAKTAAGAALVISGSGAHGRLFAGICDTHRRVEATVTIDDRLKYIIGLSHEIKPQNNDANQKTPPKLFQYENIEVSLDRMAIGAKSPGSAYMKIPAFKMPDFLYHVNCSCDACTMPAYAILACHTSFLEASLFFRSKETKIANNYFEGALQCFSLAKSKLEAIFDCTIFEDYIIDALKTRYFEELRTIEIDFLIEYAFFELYKNDFSEANNFIEKIQEISDHTVDNCQLSRNYVKNEITNLLMAICHLSKPKKTPKIKSLEIEFDNLKIIDEPKTPESSVMPKMDSPKVVPKEEIPQRIKLFSDDKEQTPQKMPPKFKIPEILISKPHVDTTPKIKTASPEEFFTPKSPGEKFFTPLPKTYTRKVAKNLEFFTPSEPQSKTRSLRKKALVRATSPGKLGDGVVTRSRRVKQPNFDDKD